MAGGVAEDKGYHLLYLAEEVCRAPIVDCQWRSNSVRWAGIVDTWMAQTGHANGATCSLLASWAATGRGADVLEVHGTEGSLYLDPALNAPVRLARDDGMSLDVPVATGDPWGYRGMFLAAVHQVIERQATDLTGPRQWASVLAAAAPALTPAVGTIALDIDKP